MVGGQKLWPQSKAQGARLTVLSHRRDVPVSRSGAQLDRHLLQACGIADGVKPVAIDVERTQLWAVRDELLDELIFRIGLAGAHPPVVDTRQTRLWHWPKAIIRAGLSARGDSSKCGATQLQSRAFQAAEFAVAAGPCEATL